MHTLDEIYQCKITIRFCQQIEQLVALGIHVVGDLVVTIDEQEEWIPGACLGLPWIDEITKQILPPSDRVW